MARRALLQLSSALAFRFLRDFICVAVPAYCDHWRALHYGIPSSPPQLERALQSTLRPGLLSAELLYVLSAVLLQHWLEARFPTKPLPRKEDELDTEIMQRLIATGRVKPVRIRWRNVWTKWLLENIVFTSVMGILTAVIAGHRFNMLNGLLALEFHFFNNWDWLVCVFAYIYLAPGYRLQLRDLAEIAAKLLTALAYYSLLGEPVREVSFELVGKEGL